MDAHQVEKGKRNRVLSISLRPFQGNLSGDCTWPRERRPSSNLRYVSQKTAKL